MRNFDENQSAKTEAANKKIVERMPALDPSVLFPPTSHELELLVLAMSVECTVMRVSLGPLYHRPSRIRTLRFRRTPSAGPPVELVRRMGVVDNTIIVVGDDVVAAGRRFCVDGLSGMRHNRGRAHRQRRRPRRLLQKWLDSDDAEREGATWADWVCTGDRGVYIGDLKPLRV